MEMILDAREYRLRAVAKFHWAIFIVRCLSMVLRCLNYFRPYHPYVRVAVYTLQRQVLAYLLVLISTNH